MRFAAFFPQLELDGADICFEFTLHTTDLCFELASYVADLRLEFTLRITELGPHAANLRLELALHVGNLRLEISLYSLDLLAKSGLALFKRIESLANRSNLALKRTYLACNKFLYFL